MPRASDGTYSLPPGTIVNTGDTILPSQHNPAMTDIAAALSASMTRNGGSFAGPVGFPAGITGSVNFNGALGAPSLSLSGALGVQGPATFSNIVSFGVNGGISGNVSISGSVGTNLDVTVGRNLGVGGSSTFNGVVAFGAGVSGPVTATGAVSGSNVSTTGILTGGTLSVPGTLSASGGQVSVSGQLAAGSLQVNQAANFSNKIDVSSWVGTSSGFQVNGIPVVRAQQAAVANATDAASAVTQLNLLLARLRVHGLISN